MDSISGVKDIIEPAVTGWTWLDDRIKNLNEFFEKEKQKASTMSPSELAATGWPWRYDSVKSLNERIGELEFHFDFEATPYIKRMLRTKIRKFLRKDVRLFYEELYSFKECHVQKFKTLEEATILWEVLEDKVGCLAKLPSRPFQISGDKEDNFYLCWIPLGEPINLNLFKSQQMYDGKSGVLFITAYYKGIIRSLLSLVYGLKDTKVRCRMDMNYIYTVVNDDEDEDDDGFAMFVRFDVQEGIKDDASDLTQNLKVLFDDFNKTYSKCGIEEGSYRAEFDLLFKNYTLGKGPNIVLANPIFWNKAQRRLFLQKIDEVIKASKYDEIKIYGECTEDAIKEDWGHKLIRHPHMEKLLKEEKSFCKYRAARFQACPEKSIRDLINIVSGVYRNFVPPKEGIKEEYNYLGNSVGFENADQLVDFIQYCFPALTSALFQRAKKEEWALSWKELETYCNFCDSPTVLRS